MDLIGDDPLFVAYAAVLVLHSVLLWSWIADLTPRRLTVLALLAVVHGALALIADHTFGFTFAAGQAAAFTLARRTGPIRSRA